MPLGCQFRGVRQNKGSARAFTQIGFRGVVHLDNRFATLDSPDSPHLSDSQIDRPARSRVAAPLAGRWFAPRDARLASEAANQNVPDKSGKLQMNGVTVSRSGGPIKGKVWAGIVPRRIRERRLADPRGIAGGSGANRFTPAGGAHDGAQPARERPQTAAGKRRVRARGRGSPGRRPRNRSCAGGRSRRRRRL